MKELSPSEVVERIVKIRGVSTKAREQLAIKKKMELRRDISDIEELSKINKDYMV